MEILPIGLKLTQQDVLLVGGGGVALRKARLLVSAGAKLNVLAPELLAPELETLIQDSGGSYVKASYPSSGSQAPIDLSRFRLIIAATDNKAVNALVYEHASALNLLVNSVDDPPHCNFIVPAIIDRSPLLVSVATGGQAPVMARQLRAKIEGLVPAKLGELAKFSGDWRQASKDQIKDPEVRRVFWEQFYESPEAEAVLSGNRKLADAAMPRLLSEFTEPEGEVYLVGAGPGDPELLTFKALRLMQQADVVLYDRLVSPAVLELTRRDAERIYVGKAKANHAVPQDKLSTMLASLAKEGKRVCRLKGGDPFIFGRGGEEIQTLVEHKVKFQVVPGITAASGCGSYAGIPLTHRDYAQSVRFLTGHLKDGSLNLPWSELVFEHQTLVIYMGLSGLKELTAKLIEHGMRPDMPCALISKGTLPDEQVVEGMVSNIAQAVESQQLAAPTLTIIGEVVSLRQKLMWR